MPRHDHAELALGKREDARRRGELRPGELEVLVPGDRGGEAAIEPVEVDLLRGDEGLTGGDDRGARRRRRAPPARGRTAPGAAGGAARARRGRGPSDRRPAGGVRPVRPVARSGTGATSRAARAGVIAARSPSSAPRRSTARRRAASARGLRATSSADGRRAPRVTSRRDGSCPADAGKPRRARAAPGRPGPETLLHRRSSPEW